MRGISVIICCYNSATRLPETMHHIAKQKVPDDVQWEIILIDNASTDNTNDIALEEWNKYQLKSIDFKVIKESKPGLNHARYTGANAAKYDTLVFCDDDNWLDEAYLANAFYILESSPKLGIAGAGNARAKYATIPTPKWFVDFQHFCCVYEMGKENKVDLKCDGSVLAAGAGMCIRKSLLLSYFKNQDKEKLVLDRVKEQLSSGGDTDINYFSLKNGFGIGLFANMNYIHYIPSDRISKTYLKKLAYSLTFSSIIVANKNQIFIRKWNNLGLLKNFIRLFFQGQFFSMQISWQQYLAQKKAFVYLNQ